MEVYTMKKWITGIVFQLACIPAAFGMYSGNPADPMLGNGSLYFCDSPWWSPKLGFQRDYVLDRKLKTNSLHIQRVDEFEINSDQATIAFDFCRSFEVYGSVGAARAFMRNRPDLPPADPQKHQDWETSDGTIWSVGGKVILWDCSNAIVSVLGGYEQYRTNFEWIGIQTVNPADTKAKLRYSEWQVSVGGAYNFCCAVPYINLNFSGLTSSKVTGVQTIPQDDTTVSVNTICLKTRKCVGLSIGTSFAPVDCFYVTVEARVINERALTLQGQLKF